MSEAWFVDADGYMTERSVDPDVRYWRVAEPAPDCFAKAGFCSLDVRVKEYERCGPVFCQITPDAIAPGEAILALINSNIRLRTELKRFQLSLDLPRLERLRDAIGAVSVGEVMQRAVDQYEASVSKEKPC